MPSRSPGPVYHSGHKSKVTWVFCWMSSHGTGTLTSWKAILGLVVYIKQDFKNTGKYFHESDIFSEEFMLLTFFVSWYIRGFAIWLVYILCLFIKEPFVTNWSLFFFPPDCITKSYIISPLYPERAYHEANVQCQSGKTVWSEGMVRIITWSFY